MYRKLSVGNMESEKVSSTGVEYYAFPTVEALSRGNGRELKRLRPWISGKIYRSDSQDYRIRRNLPGKNLWYALPSGKERIDGTLWRWRKGSRVYLPVCIASNGGVSGRYPYPAGPGCKLCERISYGAVSGNAGHYAAIYFYYELEGKKEQENTWI